MGHLNSLAEGIDTAAYRSQYDASVKRILSEKQVLARILRGAVSEVSDFSLEEIIASIEGTPQISQLETAPGLTNHPRINGKSNEDSVPDEGRIYFDIVFDLVNAKIPRAKFIINIEAQKKNNPGYDLVSRAIYYCARLISSQLGREFVGHATKDGNQYSDIKKVYSIWVCMDTSEKYRDSIVRYDIKPSIQYGSPKISGGHDLLSVVMLYLGDHSEESNNQLIGFLGDLMKAEAAENKKKRLETRYGISMTDGFDREVNSMCNLSELVEERGIKKGRAEGLAEGLAQGLQDMVYSLHDANVPLEQIYTIVKGRKNYANVTEKEILSLYQSAMQNGRHD